MRHDKPKAQQFGLKRMVTEAWGMGCVDLRRAAIRCRQALMTRGCERLLACTWAVRQGDAFCSAARHTFALQVPVATAHWQCVPILQSGNPSDRK
eukprot:1299065-Amphidinium_carterae.1